MSFAKQELKYGCFSSIGGRNYQEDRLVMVRNERNLYFAVFDGHGGSVVSDFLSKNFHTTLSQHAKIKNQPLTALQECWATFDEKCYEACQVVEAKDQSKSFPQDGSTATVCYISGEDIYVTNCGDSAAYSVSTEDSSLVGMLLTEDHGTLNASEVLRCEKAGGKLKTESYSIAGTYPFCCIPTKVVGKPRVYPGGLLVTRAFGDFHAKVEYLGGRKGVVVHEHGKIKYLQTTKSGLRYLLIASDGVWDGLSVQEVLDIVSSSAPGESTAAPATPEIQTSDNGTKQKVSVKAVIPLTSDIASQQNNSSDNTVMQEVQALVDGGVISASISDLDSELSALAKRICVAAVQSKRWIEYGSSADNTSCIVVRIEHNNQL